jgi:hypothetical protein
MHYQDDKSKNTENLHIIQSIQPSVRMWEVMNAELT